ncbi:unnamed protein product [Rotaria sordida]|uniref:Uncharacterized protein n=1 Tax=Rotaria sordida TaxID=392033 RepID=A0A814W7V2_9BILA|nr:unnamed protein product [Rotaria sordida]
MTYQLIYMAVVLYTPALALSQTTELNIWLSVIAVGVICTFYSSVGGLKAVIWTDVLQSVIMLVGLLPAIIQARETCINNEDMNGTRFEQLRCSLNGALCYAELGCSYVSSGGDYIYLRLAFSNLIGFLRVWINVALLRLVLVVLIKCLSSFLLLIVGFINLISATAIKRLHQY